MAQLGRGCRITSIDLLELQYEVRDFGQIETSDVYEPGTLRLRHSHAIRIHTAPGITGEYVSTFTVIEPDALAYICPILIGQNALEREKIYNDVKRVTRHIGRMGLAPIDIALWDIAGKYYNAPIYELLGGFRKKLRVYASTAFADRFGGLDSPAAFADLAVRCHERGYRGFKIHPWWDGPISQEVALVHTVGKKVGGKMDLMLDPCNAYQTLADAIKVGRACDEEQFFWLEDPLADGGLSHFGHRKLRSLIKTPLLQGEHVRGLEERMNFLIADATDFVRADVKLEGITGTMKLAHAAESLGVDVELHLGDPPTRHCMAAIRNSNYYEWGLIHPKMQKYSDPLYRDGYMDGAFDGIDADGCVAVPEGVGLGVEYDWDYIKQRTVGSETFK